ncbi:MAG: cytochrome c biogenesis protein CcdA [Rhodobacteraceae bacterium]|jgi:cytochrome c-type biogenesis protein|uniref:cytochrome c biogenesis CcdA family protein n=2 Tax=Planktotalea sp. TaxID=2029877 RepID=UPI001D7573BE|nr:cytochrome c biogenesis CcdA family protein [Planktotalea sp.]MBT5823070.1 cytochrome c biogenesis protein CcdA [Paracoccaceae bacterium]MDG1082838.1 cytochrome c biogenesis CcdA family protein [Planktotalea sp.]
MDLVFAYGAGLLTLINPCVLPVLPIVLATALQASRWGPVALAAGMSLSFAILGVTVSAFGRAVGLNADDIAQVGAVLMILFGLVLLVPQTSAVFSTATAGFAARADSGLDEVDRGSLTGQFVGGMLLGAVWSPCVGPTLGGAISLASQGESLLRATAIMLFFALGISTIILALGYGARSALQKRQAAMRRFAAAARPLLGAIFVAVGLMLFFKWHYFIESWLLDIMPIWLQDLSITL